MEKYTGKIFHARDFKNLEDFRQVLKNKSVLIIGSGISALDLFNNILNGIKNEKYNSEPIQVKNLNMLVRKKIKYYAFNISVLRKKF